MITHSLVQGSSLGSMLWQRGRRAALSLLRRSLGGFLSNRRRPFHSKTPAKDPKTPQPSTPSQESSCPPLADSKQSKTKKRCRRRKKTIPATTKPTPSDSNQHRAHSLPATPFSAASPGLAVASCPRKKLQSPDAFDAKKTLQFSTAAQNAAPKMQAVKKTGNGLSSDHHTSDDSK